jgi:uncharacterized membrane protein (Fun14 family)
MEDKNGMAIEYAKTRVVASELQIEESVFSAGGGFLLGTAAGFAIKKVMKIAAVVVGLFVAAIAYLSYKGLIDVKWVAMENATRSALTTTNGQVVHALNNTATQFAAHPSVYILIVIHRILHKLIIHLNGRVTPLFCYRFLLDFLIP